jgi:LuxR family transcriptional regulator, activator of conjugal transfer of Ti plasmids
MEHYSAFREFTYNLDVATCSSMLRQAAGKLFESLGFEFFMYNVFPSDAVVISNTGQDLVLTNFPPQWVSHYMSEDFGKVDPVPGYLVTENRICHWDRLIASTTLTKEQQRFKDDAMSAHISSGITLRIGSRHGEFATLICVPARNASLCQDQLAELEPILELVGNYFHAKALNILVRERLSAQSQMQVASLTPREREVLYWASLGKTGWETGTILGISQKSVELHTDNAKTKLAATNKTHAVAKAIMCGIIPDLREAGDFTQLAWKMGFEEPSQQRYLAH